MLDTAIGVPVGFCAPACSPPPAPQPPLFTSPGIPVQTTPSSIHTRPTTAASTSSTANAAGSNLPFSKPGNNPNPTTSFTALLSDVEAIRRQGATQAAHDVLSLLPQVLSDLHSRNDALFYLHPCEAEPQLAVYLLAGAAVSGGKLACARPATTVASGPTPLPGELRDLVAASEIAVLQTLHDLAPGLTAGWVELQLSFRKDHHRHHKLGGGYQQEEEEDGMEEWGRGKGHRKRAKTLRVLRVSWVKGA